MLEIHWDEQWVEALTLILLAVGFIMAILLRNPFLNYLLMFLTGFQAARIYFMKRRKEPIFPFILMIAGFLLGYLLGSFWSSRFWTLIFFVVGYGISYYLHVKGILTIFKSEPFLKQ